jgi:hypothetical protein
MLENIPPPSCAAFLALSPALGSIFRFSPVTGSFSEIPQLAIKKNIIISVNLLIFLNIKLLYDFDYIELKKIKTNL